MCYSTGETSWTKPEVEGSEVGDSLWREAYDEASGTTYYYHIHTGETSWTRPNEDDELEEDLSYLSFSVTVLQAHFRGWHDRILVKKMMRSMYEISTDPGSGVRVFTNVRTREATLVRPLLYARLGIAEGDEIADEDSEADSEDFEALADAEIDEDENPDNNEEGDDEPSTITNKKKRKFPRSKAQQLVDFAEDSPDTATSLNLSGLNAYKLSSRIWNLDGLLKLVLSHNKLVRLPSGLQDLTKLEVLDVDHNLLNRLPSCLQTTESLRELRAAHNRISSFSARLWKLRGLRELDLSHNLLKQLPFVEGDLTLLRETREWQVGVGLLRELEIIKLNNNEFTAAPISIGQCESLVFLDMSYNFIKGPLLDEIAGLKSLKILRLAHNSITTLPENIGDLGSLEDLDVSYNSLQSVPDTIGALHNLKSINLANNDLQALPNSFGALEQLECLVVDSNGHFAALGAFMRRLSGLKHASFANCAIARIDSPDIFREAPLQTLVLSNNLLSSFHLIFGKNSLELLDLSTNQLSEAPIEILENCQRLHTVNLSENQLINLPHTVSRLKSLECLRLDGNYIEKLPDEVTSCGNLVELHCNRNLLIALPGTIHRLHRLEHLHVSFNQIRALPSALRELKYLRCVYANDNLLEIEPPMLWLLEGTRCFFEVSNNPFTSSKSLLLKWKEVFSKAIGLINANEFAKSDDLMSHLIHQANSATSDVLWADKVRYLPRWHYHRAISRVLQLTDTEAKVTQLSERVSVLETSLTTEELLKSRSKYEKLNMSEALKSKVENQEELHECFEKDVIEDKALANEEQPEDGNDGGTKDNGLQLNVVNMKNDREKVILKHQQLARGALHDLRKALAGDIQDRTTAHYLEGIAHIACRQYAEATRSFSSALDAIVQRPNASVGGDQKVPRESIRILEKRAEAFCRLGQLPRAIEDIDLALHRFPTGELGEERRDQIQSLHNEYARLWEMQRTEYFVDDHEVCRAYDVEHNTGLFRRPEVTDILADEDDENNAPAKGKKKRQARDEYALPPAQRYEKTVASTYEALESEDARVRSGFEAILKVNALHLARARDFKRGVRETLQLEMEEARQRAVEAELARLALERAAEREREFNERLFMKYEDDYTAWLVAEIARLEEEERRRQEQALKKQEAQAAYAKRLARRGGKRQAQSRRK